MCAGLCDIMTSTAYCTIGFLLYLFIYLILSGMASISLQASSPLSGFWLAAPTICPSTITDEQVSSFYSSYLYSSSDSISVSSSVSSYKKSVNVKVCYCLFVCLFVCLLFFFTVDVFLYKFLIWNKKFSCKTPHIICDSFVTQSSLVFVVLSYIHLVICSCLLKLCFLLLFSF